MFPFIYEGVKYDKCTSTHAAEGAVWCATQVHANETVIEGRWGDCSEGCPGARKYLIRGIRTKKEATLGSAAPITKIMSMTMKIRENSFLVIF